MIHLMLVRHGETAWNAQRRFQGHSDIPLSDVGQHQAAALGRRLAREKIHAIYTSDLQRAWQTAMAIATHHNLPVSADPRLREIHFGAWEGLTYAEVEQRRSQTLAGWRANPLEVSPPDGESLGQLAKRVRAVLASITQIHPDEVVLLVTHGGVLQALFCLALGLPLKAYWQFHLAPGSLSVVSFYEEGAIVNLLNDTCHLDKTNNDR